MNVSSLNRHDEAVKLKRAGLTYAEIGSMWNISKERVRQIVNDKSRPRKHKPESKVMLTVGDVAQCLGLHSNTVRRWSEEGVLKSCRIGPRRDRRYRWEDIQHFLGLGEKEVPDGDECESRNA